MYPCVTALHVAYAVVCRVSCQCPVARIAGAARTCFVGRTHDVVRALRAFNSRDDGVLMRVVSATLDCRLQAAGVLPVAHNSGGPRDDIVCHGVTGFLATEPREYASMFAAVLDGRVSSLHVVCSRAVLMFLSG